MPWPCESQLERFLDFSPGAGGAVMANNIDWLGQLSLIDFLRDTGKHFTIPYMLAKDSVQVRLDRGLSFTEFSYMLLQAYDFAHMYREMGVELQMGGADQWGNITAGLELIRRTTGAGEEAHPAHGLAYKLLLSPSGTKFGKSESGESVWLDPQRTSPYAFYQHWLNTDDRDVGTYLRWFTELSREEIEALEAEAASHPEARAAQRALARDITARTHGEAAATEAIRDSEAMFAGGPIADPAVLQSLFESTGGFTFDPATLAGGRRDVPRGCGRLPVARRGAPDDRGRGRDDQRGAGHGSGVRSGAHRRGVARGPHRQAPPGDRSPGKLSLAATQAVAFQPVWNKRPIRRVTGLRGRLVAGHSSVGGGLFTR